MGATLRKINLWNRAQTTFLPTISRITIRRDRTHYLIECANEARQRFNAAAEGSIAECAAELELDRALAALTRNVPTTDGGMLALIRYTRRTGAPDPGVVLERIERALCRRLA